MPGMNISALDTIERPLASEQQHVERHDGVAEEPREDRKGHYLVKESRESKRHADRNQKQDGAVRGAITRMHRRKPLGDVSVASHRKPGARRIVNASIRRSNRREQRTHEKCDLQNSVVADRGGIEQWYHRDAEVLP